MATLRRALPHPRRQKCSWRHGHRFLSLREDRGFKKREELDGGKQTQKQGVYPEKKPHVNRRIRSDTSSPGISERKEAFDRSPATISGLLANPKWERRAKTSTIVELVGLRAGAAGSLHLRSARNRIADGFEAFFCLFFARLRASPWHETRSLQSRSLSSEEGTVAKSARIPSGDRRPHVLKACAARSVQLDPDMARESRFRIFDRYRCRRCIRGRAWKLKLRSSVGKGGNFGIARSDACLRR